MNTEELNKLFDANTGDIFVNFVNYFTSKVRPSRLYPNDGYGFEIRVLHYDEYARIPKSIASVKKNGLGTGFINEYQDGPNASPKVITLTANNFGRFFIDTYTYEDFANDVIQIKNELIKERVKKEANDSTATRQLNTLIGTEDAENFKEITIRFFSQQKFGNTYTQADRNELFSKIYRDEHYNLYFKFDRKNEASPLTFKDNSEDRVLMGNSTDPDYQFWPDFFTEFDPKFSKWDELIRTEIMNFDWTGSNDMCSVEERLMNAGVPRFFLESIVIKVVLRGVKLATKNGTKIQYYYDSMQIALDNGPSNSTWKNQNKIAVFAKSLMSPIDIRKCAEMPLYTNDENEVAAHFIKRPVARASETEPELPPTWKKFLGGTRFWDPKMDKLKIACFIDNVLNAKYTGRQALFLGGTGEDGKGTFVRILYEIIGTKLACSLEAKDFADDDDFGLAPVFNKKLVTLPDCKSISKLISTDKFKSLTGADYLDIKQKYMKSRRMDAKGICLCGVTNHWFYVNAEFGRSRILPVVFRKNFNSTTQMDKGELSALLKSEKEEFVQWCVDYKKYYQDKYPGLVLGSKLILCTDEDICNVGKEKEEELFKRMCEKQILDETTGSKLVHWNESTEEDEDIQNDLAPIFKTIFTELMANPSHKLPVYSYNGTDYYCGKDLLFLMNEFLEKRRTKDADEAAQHCYNNMKSIIGKDFVLSTRSKEWLNYLKSIPGYITRTNTAKHIVPCSFADKKNFTTPAKSMCDDWT